MNSMEEILKRVERIFRQELGDESLEITYESSPDSVANWTSITNLFLISAMEREFKITFSIDFIFDAQCVGDYCEYVLKARPSE